MNDILITQKLDHEPEVILDFSMMSTFLTCPRQFLYEHEYNITLHDDKPNLIFGGGVHEAMDYFYTCIMDKKVIKRDTFVLKFLEYVNGRLPIAGTHLSLDRGVELLEEYYRIYYRLDPYNMKVLMVEVPFYMIVSDTIAYVGRIDGVIEYEDRLLLLEHKTTSALNPTYFSNYRPHYQISGYLYAYEKLTGVKPSGVILNAMSTKKLVTKPAAHHYIRESIRRSPGEMQEFEMQLRMITNEIKWRLEQKKQGVLYDEAIFYQNTGACYKWFSPCPYLQLCEVSPDKRKSIIDAHYRYEKWQPYDY